jgi:hypothetical protein
VEEEEVLEYRGQWLLEELAVLEVERSINYSVLLL